MRALPRRLSMLRLRRLDSVVQKLGNPVLEAPAEVGAGPQLHAVREALSGLMPACVRVHLQHCS